MVCTPFSDEPLSDSHRGSVIVSHTHSSACTPSAGYSRGGRDKGDDGRYTVWVICNVCGASFSGNSSHESNAWINAEDAINQYHFVNGMCPNQKTCTIEGQRTITDVSELAPGDTIISIS